MSIEMEWYVNDSVEHALEGDIKHTRNVFKEKINEMFKEFGLEHSLKSEDTIMSKTQQLKASQNYSRLSLYGGYCKKS